ncbi:MAG: PAS domain S-box protein [Smithella sp.]|nr:PAS domain S-box protein [Smithella sp.]HOU49857.1 PAS domain S-box protein [Smithella sp.]HQG64586.1 PAS domain S-box protein [Smithella sp.]HQH15619.1 PAS domain S-box protein [Smithella sp.]HQI73787.1 PAS domain S-box protein [Smithella sp.]
MKKAGTDQLIIENRTIKKRIKGLEGLLPDYGTEQIPFAPGHIYRALFRLSPYTIVVSRLKDGLIYDVSDTFCQRSGFSREETIGKTMKQLKLWQGNEREKFVKILRKEGICRNQEVNHRMKDGTIRTCLDSGELLTIGNEQFIFLMVTDITALKKAQDSLIEERDLSNTIINSLPGLFYILDDEFRFLRWNDNLLKITGYSAQELQKMTILNFHREADRRIVVEDTKKTFLFGENRSEADVVMKDGTVKTFFFSSKLFYYKNKPCSVGTGIDITEQKRIAKELKNKAEILEDANIALRVLMNQKEVDRKNFEEKLQTNINDLVMPYLHKLKNAGLDNRHKNYLSILEKNLNDVTSPFMRDFKSSYGNLTPQEIQIVDLIKQGRKTKEIADILNSSAKTVETHRNNIRKKLNLINAKINLRSHILSLK